MAADSPKAFLDDGPTSKLIRQHNLPKASARRTSTACMASASGEIPSCLFLRHAPTRRARARAASSRPRDTLLIDNRPHSAEEEEG